MPNRAQVRAVGQAGGASGAPGVERGGAGRWGFGRAAAWGAWGVVVLGAAGGAGAQETDAFIQQQRRIEREIRAQMDRELPLGGRFELDYGGWYTFNFFLYDDGIESSRTLRRHDLRVWGRLALEEGAHQFYVRGRLSLQDFNSGDSFDGDDDDWEGPVLERGYYQFSLRQAVWSRERRRMPYDVRFKVGRDLVEFGTGYALSVPLIHVLASVEVGDWLVTGVAGRTPLSLDNLDRSRPRASRSRNNIYGGEVRYLGFANHQPFAYFVWNEDILNDDDRFLRIQPHDYESYYVGLGSQGELIENLRYGMEWVYEGGRTYGFGVLRGKDEINAWGFDAVLEYLFDHPTQPRVLVEYMFASGDGDRRGSPTNAIGGNTKGDDTSFVSFGYRDTGLSLAPRLSNLHIWRVGASLRPFPDSEALRSLEVGTDWFLFHKHHRDGAISDPLATERSGYVGWEMDWFANYRVTSDLAWTIRYGVFFPGKAFADRTTRTFLVTGVTWSF